MNPQETSEIDGEDGDFGRLKAESGIDAAETFVQRLYRRHHEAAGPGHLPELDFDAGVTVRVRASVAPGEKV